MKPTLICMVGLPRSGKSTWARGQNNTPIVSGDAIRLALHGQRFLPDAEPMVHAIAHYMVPALFKAGHNEVIVDECNISKKRREAWFSDDWDTVFHYIDTPYKECLRRAKADNDNVIIPVIKRMHKEFDWVPVRESVDDLIDTCPFKPMMVVFNPRARVQFDYEMRMFINSRLSAMIGCVINTDPDKKYRGLEISENELINGCVLL